MKSDLEYHVKDHESCGAYREDGCLGFRKMPEGYALMLNPDRTHFYWLRYDGVESVICWDKWGAYRGAIKDSKTKKARLHVTSKRAKI